MTSNKIIKYIWLVTLVPFLLLITLVIFISTEVFVNLPSVQELQNPKNNLSTVIYSSDLTILGKYYTENRVTVKYSEIDKDVINALIATEDARFLQHSGIDVIALGRAVFGIIIGKSSSGGGSTLSQQLAKMMFPRQKLNPIQMVIQKIKEWVIAVRLEKNYTKEEIITMYLNKFDFLNQAVGIKSAAQIYFNKLQDSLSIEQAAMLVGMAKNPAVYNPLRKPELVKQRRNVVLNQMLVNENITKIEYDSLKKLPLILNYMAENNNEGLAPYFREYLRDKVLKKWCEQHINPETNKPYNLYKDGLKIYTTLNYKMQKYAEEAVYEHMKYVQGQFEFELKQKKQAPFAWNITKDQIQSILNSAKKRSDRYINSKRNGLSEREINKDFNTKIAMTVYSPKGEIDTIMTPWDSIRYYKRFLQTGFVAIEPSTGFVKAWVGGINHKHFKFDHVKVSKRQVGSTFKPFVYAIAIQEGYSPCYQVANVKTCVEIPDQETWCPENSDGDVGTGKMVTLRYALAGSINYVSAWLIKQFGAKAVIDLVRRLGITSHIDEVPSIALGTAEVTLIEMVGANAAFANKGTYIEPTFISKIEDKNGKVLELFYPKTDEVMNESKAYTMIQLMRGVVDRGTGIRLRLKYKLDNEIAGKTGTTQHNADAWFIGLTPELAAGCWSGGDDRSIHFDNMAEGQGAAMALPVWGLFFQKIYADASLNLKKAKFERPKNMANIELDCSKYDSKLEQSAPSKKQIEEDEE